MPHHQSDTPAKTIGVAIQGPLVTYGQGPNNTPQGFNATKSILANIENIKKHNFAYVLCTWTPEFQAETEILRTLESKGVHVISVDVPKISDPDHRYKHHYGISRAVEKLDADFLVKIRTDMILPDEFWDWLSGSLDHRLVVSELITPFYLGDFIYAGSRETFLDYLEALLSHGNRTIHPSITTDLGFKYYEHLTGRRVNRKLLLAMYVFGSAALTAQWEEFAAGNIRVVPAHIYRKIVWRGRPIENVINTAVFKFDTKPPFLPLDTNFLLGEYLRFYSKRGSWRRHLVRLTIRLFKTTHRFVRIFRKLAGLRQ